MRTLTTAEIGRMSRAEAEAAVRDRCRAVPLGHDEILCRVLGKHKVYLSTRDVGFAGHVMLDGFWEMWLTLFFARRITPGMTVVDVGANCGYYTCLFADAVGPSGRVIAVEPVPDTAALLARTVALNGYDRWTTISAVALGAEAGGTLHMLVPPGEPKNAAVVSADVPGAIAVPTTSLDSLCAPLQRCDLIKIDAEGAEIAIVAGLRATIARLRPSLLLEFNAARYPEPRAFLDALLQLYPSVQTIDGEGRLVQATPKKILSENVGEDWLLYFA